MKFLQTFKEHYFWIEINNSFNQRKQIFFMWSITFVVLSYNENPDSRSSVNPDNIPLQVHPKVLLYKITHIQCQNWIAFWRTRIVSLLLVKIYTYWYTCIWLCTSIIWMPLSNMTIPFTYIVILRMTFTMMGWYGCFLLNSAVIILPFILIVLVHLYISTGICFYFDFFMLMTLV